MPQPTSSLPLRPRPGFVARPVVVTGLAGLLALVAMALVTDAEVLAALVLAAPLTALTLFQARRARQEADRLRAELAQTHVEVAEGALSLPYTSVLNALPDPVMVISAHEPDDLTGRRFVMVNRAGRRVLKIQREAGLLVTAIRDPDVLEVVDEALFGGLEGEAVYEPGGMQERIFRVYARPLGAAGDGSRLALLVLHDETDIRRVERMRADFLANASHELRTPLASLSGFIETLRGHARGDELARDRFLGIMHVQAERMSRLIDDLMSLSRIELNEHVRPLQDVDLSAAVLDVIDALAPLARDKGVTLEAEAPPRGEVTITGDRDQVIQVAQNLVDNALKYSERGGRIRILLETGLAAEACVAPRMEPAARLSLLTPDHGPERYATLSVIDAGPGMQREHLPRLTERFYRVEGQKSGEKLGTGLGLAIVKHIMNRHRGGLSVESRPGAGTVFTAYFPLAETGAAPAPDNFYDVAKLS
ncbi:cell wall metabolism sensor histidine kinase WalK [Phenylobacterium sp.]|uniref:sensor histidine kinase n=1 Tax=Phenylobacterium sp. TaxID=1871053 RepID=UPI0027315B14|nr:ATP-binding protein [Phenylobacterium sp.]MDP1874873.1 ATP-binding protein [Phenylobacterium sp.]MDP3488694.1 ATP-binding protein [Phenylobacterium sp.]